MRRNVVVLLALVICPLACSSVYAVDWAKIFCVKWCVPDCPQPKCCDDYAPKCAPCVPKITCFGCDDYCPKCEPCVPPIGCFGCDDYCAKCPPKLTCPPCVDLRCVSTASCGRCQGACRCASSAAGPCGSSCDRR